MKTGRRALRLVVGTPPSNAPMPCPKGSQNRRSWLLLASLVALAAVGWFLLRPSDAPPRPGPTATAPPVPTVSSLADAPDWSQLSAFQETITRHEFEHLLTTVFVTGSRWREFIEIQDHAARILTGNPPDAPSFILRFAAPGQEKPVARSWRAAAELTPAPPDRPLAGLRIAIDPGHIGGEWAKIEERWLQVADTPPVCEGNLTLQVARLLKPRLEEMGASVTLVRETQAPLTPLRPEALTPLARQQSPGDLTPADVRKLAERLFYRTAEIRARAQRVNEQLTPDLVLCLHFNAEPWGDPNAPRLVPQSHLHLLLNGAYTDEELALADQRFAMLEKLLSRSHQEEARVGATIADTFAAATGLPPYQYPQDAGNVRPVDGHPYLWARNLLANRLYRCPVIFLEPYVMNSETDHPRLVAGDYGGLRLIAGKPQPSILREYADALVQGLRHHYQNHRKP